MKDLAPGAWRRYRVSVILYRCARCLQATMTGARTIDQRPEPPARCGSCGSPNWQVPVGTLRRGRPPKVKPAA